MKLFIGLVLIALLAGCNLTTAPTLTPTLNAPTTQPTVETIIVTATLPPTSSTPTASAISTLELTPTLSASAAIGVDVAFPTLYINSYSISAREGQTIYVNYEVTLDNPGQGRVFLLVLDPAGVEAGRLALSETKTDVLEVEAKTTGTYTLYVTPDNVRGNYKTSFGTR